MNQKQKSLAQALGVAPSTISAWKAAGAPVERGVEAVRAWRDENRRPYIGSDQPTPASAPPSEPGTAADHSRLDLAQERALLAREQRLGIEIKNAVARGEYAPIALLAEVLATASAAVAAHLDLLPSTLKRSCADITEAQLVQLQTVIAAARNEWVRATSELIIRKLETTDDEPDPLPPPTTPGEPG